MITEAPIKEPIVEPSGMLSRVWVQDISNLFDSLKGEWGKVGNSVFTSSFPNTVFNVRLIGDTMFFQADIESPSGAGSISWDYPFSAGATVLNLYVYNGSQWLAEGAFCEGKTITIPSLSGSRAMIKGYLLRG